MNCWDKGAGVPAVFIPPVRTLVSRITCSNGTRLYPMAKGEVLNLLENLVGVHPR